MLDSVYNYCFFIIISLLLLLLLLSPGIRMWSDFHSTNSDMWFKNLDKLIRIMNQRYPDKYHVFYSNPEVYTQAKYNENLAWSIKTDDFFPYADCPHCYWSGYFTSRPTLKYFERTSSSFLQVMKQMSVTSYDLFTSLSTQVISDVNVNNKDNSMDIINSNPSTSATMTTAINTDICFDNHPFFALSSAVGLANHHDAITGTSKQHVAYDYIRILDKARTDAEKLAALAINHFLFHTTNTNEMKIDNSNINDNEHVHMCRYFNESICEYTTPFYNTTNGQIDLKFLVIAYNPLPRKHTQLVPVLLNALVYNTKDIYVYVQTTSSISQNNIEYIYSEITPPIHSSTSSYTNNTCTLYFLAKDVPALSTKQFLIRIKSTNIPNALSAEFLSQTVRNYQTSYTPTSSTPDHINNVDTNIKTNTNNIHNNMNTNNIDMKTDNINTDTNANIKTDNNIDKTTDSNDFYIRSNTIELTFNGKTGMISHVHRNSTNDRNNPIDIDLQQVYAYYIGHGSPGSNLTSTATSTSNTVINKKDIRDPHIMNLIPNAQVSSSDAASSTQASGAYIFRHQPLSTANTSTTNIVASTNTNANTIQNTINTATTTSNNNNNINTDGINTNTANTNTLLDNNDKDTISIVNPNNQGVLSVSIIQGKLISEVRQQLTHWLSQIIRLTSDTEYIEFEWYLGSIPIHDGYGKEIISRFSSKEIKSGSAIYTDSNSREFLKRLKNNRPSWNMVCIIYHKYSDLFCLV